MECDHRRGLGTRARHPPLLLHGVPRHARAFARVRVAYQHRELAAAPGVSVLLQRTHRRDLVVAAPSPRRAPRLPRAERRMNVRLFWVTDIPTPYRNHQFERMAELFQPHGIQFRVLVTASTEVRPPWNVVPVGLVYACALTIHPRPPLE